MLGWLVKPAIGEALILTASLMSAEESYSGRRAEFSQLAWDQVLNGVYITESEERETVDPTGSCWMRTSPYRPGTEETGGRLEEGP